MRIDFVSLFPGMLRGPLGHSIAARAEAGGNVQYSFANPRDFCYDRHQKVDDSPFGGEPGMLIRVDAVALALASLAPSADCAIVLTDPVAPRFAQAHANELSRRTHLIFLCGHYEGFDHRVRTQLATHSFSVGDFVVTNGELPALLMADAILRQIPGVLGNSGSLGADSFTTGLLSAPNFTRPEVRRGQPVPEVLRGGNHREIARWRRREALLATSEFRPDLLARAPLRKDDIDVLSSESESE